MAAIEERSSCLGCACDAIALQEFEAYLFVAIVQIINILASAALQVSRGPRGAARHSTAACKNAPLECASLSCAPGPQFLVVTRKGGSRGVLVVVPGGPQPVAEAREEQPPAPSAPPTTTGAVQMLPPPPQPQPQQQSLLLRKHQSSGGYATSATHDSALKPQPSSASGTIRRTSHASMWYNPEFDKEAVVDGSSPRPPPPPSSARQQAGLAGAAHANGKLGTHSAAAAAAGHWDTSGWRDAPAAVDEQPQQAWQQQQQQQALASSSSLAASVCEVMTPMPALGVWRHVARADAQGLVQQDGRAATHALEVDGSPSSAGGTTQGKTLVLPHGDRQLATVPSAAGTGVPGSKRPSSKGQAGELCLTAASGAASKAGGSTLLLSQQAQSEASRFNLSGHRHLRTSHKPPSGLALLAK